MPEASIMPALLTHVPFESMYVRNTIDACPRIFKSAISPFAYARFSNLDVLRVLAVESMLVRDAIVAYHASGDLIYSGPSSAENLALRHYRRCIHALSQSCDITEDKTLVALTFLSALEHVKLADPDAAIRRSIVLSTLLRTRSNGNSSLQNFYRIAAEIVYYSIAVLSCFTAQHHDYLWIDFGFFPSYQASPFLSCHALYRILHSMNQDQPDLLLLQRELDSLEVPPILMNRSRPVEQAYASLYKQRHQCFTLALQIRVRKLSVPTAAATDPIIHRLFRAAVHILEQPAIQQPGDLSMTLPLILLTCAAVSDDEIEFMTEKMLELAVIVDRFSSSRLRSAVLALNWCNVSERIGYILDIPKLHLDGTQIEMMHLKTVAADSTIEFSTPI